MLINGMLRIKIIEKSLKHTEFQWEKLEPCGAFMIKQIQEQAIQLGVLREYPIFC